MNKPLTSAQLAQQTNRTEDGKYTTKSHSEADIGLGINDAALHRIELDDGGSHEINHRLLIGTGFDRAEIFNDEGQYTVEATISNTMRDCLPAQLHAMRDSFDEDDIDQYLNRRAHVIEDFVQQRYPGAQLDPGPEGVFSFDFVTDVDGPISEPDAIETLINDTKATEFHNDMVGADGAENVHAMLAQRLHDHDMAKLPNPEETDEQHKQQFINDFVSANRQDSLAILEDEIDFDDEETDIGDIDVDADTKKKLEDMAASFYDHNAGDLAAWSKVGRPSKQSGYVHSGVDAYLAASGHGSGFRSNTDAADIESEVIARRLERSTIHEMQSLEVNVELEDGQITMEGF